MNGTNGEVLFKENTGGGIAGGVITYAIGGKQYIALTSGSGSRTYLGVTGPASIIVMSLPDGKGAGPP